MGVVLWRARRLGLFLAGGGAPCPGPQGLKACRQVDLACFQPPAWVPAFHSGGGIVMCCVAQIMNNDECAWADFDPAEFFKLQKNIGQDPFVCGDFIGSKIVPDSRVDCLYRWAATKDPDGRLRSEYAQMRWANRGCRQAVVPLG